MFKIKLIGIATIIEMADAQYTFVRKPVESSRMSEGKCSGEVGFINNVATTWLTRKAPTPASRNGKKPRSQDTFVTERKVHIRLSW